MKYLIALLGAVLILVSSLNAHENPIDEVKKTAHFHDVKWQICYSGEFCKFNVEGLPSFFGGELFVQITKADVPSYTEGLCVAERRLGGAIISLLATRFKNADTIDLVMCEFSIMVYCEVKVDGDSIDEWLRRVFSLDDGRTNWCSSW